MVLMNLATNARTFMNALINWFFRSFLRANVILPFAGFAGVIALWWVIALFRH